MKENFDAIKGQMDEIANKSASSDLSQFLKIISLGTGLSTNILLNQRLGKLTEKEAADLNEYRIQLIESI